ncbi:hypothetical protein SCRM01_187 [Synechococcus phage S-CRM01]|uniref:hypothetical protein n=1 Tax=Synechococcus phage S-CRM01 TaxID=1026955 RepID=UPI000209E40C|nr:hypothetical protein SCRM01_187 [Synechococcus phage S-CRM01]AEC53133.1 hypothetical protein SCRM01_187 [Synechococcus phage S-CRM01]
MTRGVYHFYQDFGRPGSLDGVFVADIEQVEKVYGLQAYFGEVLGKHSEVYCEVTPDNLKLITDEPSDVEVFDRYNINVGYNPLDYVDFDEDDEEWDEEDEGKSPLEITKESMELVLRSMVTTLQRTDLSDSKDPV